MMFTRFASLIVLLLIAPNLLAERSSVTVERTEVGFQLRVNDKPFYINGAGGDGKFDLLHQLGGNSTRTWGIDKATDAILQRANENGLKVMLGIWLGHERHGFNYQDFKQTSKQIEQVQAAVKKYRDHPALLGWCLGNEMEGYESGDNPAIWLHIEHLARMVKRLDPHHPTMSIVAEVGGNRVKAIHELCPSLDIVGINAYGGAPTIPQRYREAGGKKPYIVTEYGPPGVWEMKKDELGIIPELTSTKKSDFYQTAFNSLKKDRELCLGSYAFLWGYKQEATATWFGMLLPTGEYLQPAETLSKMWIGKAPENGCPRIEVLQSKSKRIVKSGDHVTFQLKATDPDNDSLRVDWRVMGDSKNYNTGGDAQQKEREFKDAILDSDMRSATVVAPNQPGHYRVYAYVYDGQNHAAVGNIAFQVVEQK